MASSAILAIRIISDATKAAKDLRGVGDEAGRLEAAMDRATGPAKAVVASLTAIGLAAGKQASDLQQAQGAVESVFGAQAAAVGKLASQAATQVGLANSEYSQAAATLGAQLGNLGVAQDKLVGTTDSLISTGADLAAAFGGSTADAVDALGAAMRGEADSVEKYGLSLGDARVMAELAKRGQDKLKGAALDQAKTQARLTLITQQTSKVQGQFAREATSAAGSQQIAMAQVKDAGAQLGAVLLPVFAALMGVVSSLTAALMANKQATMIVVGVVGGLALTVLGLNYALKAYKAIQTAVTVATKAWAIAQKVLNGVLKANPVGLVVTAIMLLVAGVILAYKRSATFRSVVQAVMRAAQAAVGWVIDKVQALAAKVVDVASGIRSRFSDAWSYVKTAAASFRDFVVAKVQALRDKAVEVATALRERLAGAFSAAKDAGVRAFDALTSPIQRIVDLVRDLIGWIGDINWPSPPAWLSKVGGAVGLGGASGALAGQVMAGSVHAGAFASSSSARRSPSQPVQIIIQGAIDPESTARQIQRILGRRNVRLGVA